MGSESESELAQPDALRHGRVHCQPFLEDEREAILLHQTGLNKRLALEVMDFHLACPYPLRCRACCADWRLKRSSSSAQTGSPMFVLAWAWWQPTRSPKHEEEVRPVEGRVP